MRRRHRYIPFVWAGLFFGLATALPAESPGTVAKPKTAPPAKKAAEVVPASTGKAGADLLLQMAYAAYEAGNNALAIEKLDAAEKLQSNGAEGANLRGAIFLRTGQFAKASEQFRRAANLDPSLWVARFNVAEVPFRQKDFAAARRAFENLAIQTDRYKQDSEWELVQYKLIVCSLLTGDAADAQKRFTRLRSNPASTAKIYAQAALSFAKDEAAAANKVLALAGTPGSPALKAIYADALVAAGWMTPPASANTAYDPAAGQRGGPRVRGLPVPLLPPALDVDLPRGGGASLAGESAAPVDEPPLTKAPPPDAATPPAKTPPTKSDVAPSGSPAPKDSSEARGPRAWRYADNGGDASHWIRAANDAGDAYAAKIRDAQLRMKAKDFDGATQSLEEAAALASNPAEALNLRGALEFYRGNYPVAESLFRKALLADPASWPAKFNLAEIAFTQKEYAKARSQYENMLPDTNLAKQPIERELLQYKILLALLLEGKTPAFEKMLERMSLAGQTPARYYAQVALDVSRQRFDKAAQSLGSAEQFYPASLNYIFAQPLEKLSMLPLPGGGASAAPPPPLAEAKPTPKDESPVRNDLLPPPISDAPAAVELTDSALARTEAQLLEEIVGGRAVAPAPAPKAGRSAPAVTPPAPTPTPTPKPAAVVAEPPPAAVVATPTPVSAVATAPAIGATTPSATDSSRGWLGSLVQWLVPGSEPTRLETLLLALGLANLFGLLYLLASDLIARLFRPRSISIHAAGAVGVSVNRLRLIERLRIRLSVANMTRHSQTVGHMDTIVEPPDGIRRTFHWKSLCLNPSGSSSSFEEMDVFPLVLLPGEVASLYVDFMADGEETPTPWKRGKHQLSVLGWTDVAAKRSKPDFRLSFPLEIPNIPWKNQDIVVDLAIVRPGRKEKVPSEFELLEWEDDDEAGAEGATHAATSADETVNTETAPAAPPAAENETIIRQPPTPEPAAVVVAAPPPPRVIPPRAFVASLLPEPSMEPVPVSSVQEELIATPAVMPPLAPAVPPATSPGQRTAPLLRSAPLPASGQVRPVTPVLPAPARTNPGTPSSRPPLSRTPFLSGPGKTTTTPQILPAIGRPASATPTTPIGPLVPMIKAVPLPAPPTAEPTRSSPTMPPAPTDPLAPGAVIPPPATKLPRRPPEPPSER